MRLAIRLSFFAVLAVPLILASVLPGCGGGGGGGGGSGAPPGQPTILAVLKSDLSGAQANPVVDPDARATALLECKSDGTIDYTVAGQSGWTPDVTAISVRRDEPGPNDPEVVDLLAGGGTFGPIVPLTVPPINEQISGSVTVDGALVMEIAEFPERFYVDIRTTAAPDGLAQSVLAAFEATEVFAVLFGDQETDPVQPDARGATTFTFRPDLSVEFVISMMDPGVADLIGAHIHAGGAGVNGPIVVDLEVASATYDPVAGTLTGTVAVPSEDLTGILANLETFYVNVHTNAAPAGVARGMLQMGPIGFWAPLRGDQEVDVVDPTARGGVSLAFDSFSGGRAILAVPPAQDIDSLIMSHVHEGPPGENGPPVIPLHTGSDYGTGVNTGSAEGSIECDQTLLTRMLADPADFYVNFHTNAAPGGLVRGQLTQDAVTFFTELLGAEEVPPVDLTAAGRTTIVFDGASHSSFTITMDQPPAQDIIAAHIHDGAAGVNGAPLINFLAGGTYSVSGANLSGTCEFSGRTFARLLAAAELFYVNVHTALYPDGVARGQLTRATGEQPPSDLDYTSPVSYLVGVTITPNAPTVQGGAVSQYSVSPALPSGLLLDPVTGVISGTPKSFTVAADYTVTATNEAGSTTAVVNLAVGITLPAGLRYNSPVSFVAGSAITPLTPSSTGGPISQYSGSLPPGLNLHSFTGVISGNPMTAAPAANFVITASNPSGSTTFTINIAITASLSAPSNLSYTTPVTYPTGTSVQNTPSVGGGAVSQWQISPQLPTGLSFSTSTGVISGIPMAVSSATNYTVTASNAAGNTTAVVNITVTVAQPANLTYSPSTGVGYLSPPSYPTQTPTLGSGTATSWSISPTTLPAGVTFNSTTGVISGSPKQTWNSTNYTVTATNSAGSTTATVTIIVYP